MDENIYQPHPTIFLPFKSNSLRPVNLHRTNPFAFSLTAKWCEIYGFIPTSTMASGLFSIRGEGITIDIIDIH